MFYYYGRKKRIAKLYPEPKHGLIIEPFAGSAAYSLHGDRWRNDVLLIDNNIHVKDVWEFLLNSSKKDIELLPDELQEDLPIGATKLIGFHLNPGSTQPKLTPTKFNRWSAGKRYISENIHKIKHWNFIFGEYQDCPNVNATWFIDPPYQKAGKWYQSNNINYEHLAQWTKNREGQVIACDAPDADWLNFRKLLDSNYASIGKRRLKEGLFVQETKV